MIALTFVKAIRIISEYSFLSEKRDTEIIIKENEKISIVFCSCKKHNSVLYYQISKSEINESILLVNTQNDKLKIPYGN